jgi:hypothetical protein
MKELIGKKFRYISHFGDVLYFTIEAIIFDNGKAKAMNSNLVTFCLDEIEIL